jgi:hypothetical protein
MMGSFKQGGYMFNFKTLWLLLTSEKGEDGEEGQPAGEGAIGSVEGQGDQGASGAVPGAGQAEGQPAGQPAPLDPVALQTQLEEMKATLETLKGQSGATERNLASERKALEGMGLKVVRDTQGNVQVVPIKQANNNTRFTDEHKNKFYSYFPDQKSGESFLEMQKALVEDLLDERFSKYDKEKSTVSQFQEQRQQGIERMYQLFPNLNEKGGSFDKNFYDKANEIYMARYQNIPNGDLIAANEAAIELGIAPSSVAAANKEGFQRGQNVRKIVGGGQGSQAQGGQGGFRRLSFEEFKKLTPDQRAEYNKKEIESRGK